jgi:hypothetical protein
MRRPVALMLTVMSLIGGAIFGGVLFVSASTSIDQLGADIDGEAANDYSGWSVSLSSDGTIVAIGAFGNGSYAGHVRVYEWNSGTSSWDQKGADIDGEAAYDSSGVSVSLSDDGTIVAIGANFNNGTASNAGHVRVYEWNSGTSSWDQKGADIDGEAADDYSGRQVSLSDDGTTVAIGATGNDGTASSAGHVRVYEWNPSTSLWDQKGADIDGEAADDYSGISVSLSSDGTTVAIGAYGNDGNGSDAGHVRVYEWNPSTSLWDQKGADIDGEAANDLSGFSVSLSSDGTEVAIGAPWNDGNGSDAGHVRVYEWNPSTSLWDQKGADIDGEAAGDESGVSVSLSSDGTEVAIGAYLNDGNGSDAGHVRVYSITTSTPTTTPAASGPRVPGQVPPWPEAIPNVDGTVTVSWAEPFQDGAGPITGYRAVARPQSTPVAQASDTPVSMTSGGSCSTTGFVCVIAGLEENVDYLFEVFASNNEGESAGRMTQQAIRIVPQTPATTIPDTVPDTLPAVADPEPLPVTGNDDDLVTWSLLLIAFGALSVLYVRRTRLN